MSDNDADMPDALSSQEQAVMPEDDLRINGEPADLIKIRIVCAGSLVLLISICHVTDTRK